MKQTQFINLFEDMDFNMRLLSGEFDEAIKEGKMKITSENKSNKKVSAPKFKKQLARPVRKVDIGDAVLTEVNTIEEVIGTNEVSEEVTEIVLEPVDYLVEVNTIEEVIEAESVAEPVIDEDFSDEEEAEDLAPKSKCTDIELVIAVLDGSNKELTKEDFEESVWLEGNELYYSEPNDDEETNDNKLDFLLDRARTIQSWYDDGLVTNEVSDEYIYEDDEVNVPEECDATIMSFAKGFWCMGLKNGLI